MALIHQATLRPTKQELLRDWLPTRSWYDGPKGDVERVVTYRFDDPAGAVGIETLLVRVGDGPLYQVPLTYRAAPLAKADDLLLGTADHSVLGKRWIYDGTGDPVYVAELAKAVLANAGQVEQFMQVGDRLEPRELSMSISSNAPADAVAPAVTTIQKIVDAEPTVITTDTVGLTIVRRLGTSDLTGTVLTGTWPGQDTPITLASATA